MDTDALRAEMQDEYRDVAIELALDSFAGVANPSFGDSPHWGACRGHRFGFRNG